MDDQQPLFSADPNDELGWTYSTPAWELIPATPEARAMWTLQDACRQITTERGYDIYRPFG